MLQILQRLHFVQVLKMYLSLHTNWFGVYCMSRMCVCVCVFAGFSWMVIMSNRLRIYCLRLRWSKKSMIASVSSCDSNSTRLWSQYKIHPELRCLGSSRRTLDTSDVVCSLQCAYRARTCFTPNDLEKSQINAKKFQPATCDLFGLFSKIIIIFSECFEEKLSEDGGRKDSHDNINFKILF